MEDHRHQELQSTTLDPVLVAAREVIMEKGPSRATLAEVARRAGVSRMTVYRRFETWDRVVSALLSIELGQLLVAAENENSTAATIRQRAVGAVTTLTRSIGDHELLRRVADVDPQSLLPLMTSRFGQTQRAAAAHLTNLLATGMSTNGGDGSIRDEDPQVMAMTCLMLCQSYVLAAPALDDEPDGVAIRNQLPVAIDAYLAPSQSPKSPPQAQQVVPSKRNRQQEESQ